MGTPQGCCLSPLLYSLFIHNCAKFVHLWWLDLYTYMMKPATVSTTVCKVHKHETKYKMLILDNIHPFIYPSIYQSIYSYV